MLTQAVTEWARQYGRYGCRRITALLHAKGWACHHKRVERIWRLERLRVPARQPERSRLWLNDGSCVRLRPEPPNPVWAYDFVEDRTRDGRKARMLNVVERRRLPDVDEFTRECLCLRVGRKLKAAEVPDARASSGIGVLADLFITRGTPRYIRSDNGGEFAAAAVKGWITGVRDHRRARQHGVYRTGQPVGERLCRKRSPASCGTSCWAARCSTASSKPAC
jgi:hypothetical protein